MKNLRLSYSCVTTSVFARRLVLGLLVALFPVIHLGWDARSFAASRLSITTEPASQTVTSGQSATFTVVATGHNPHYQWLKNGVAISGANLPSYTTPPTTSSDNGAQFTAVVRNSAGSVTSNAATLTVTTPGQLSSSTSSVSFGNVDLGMDLRERAPELRVERPRLRWVVRIMRILGIRND